MIKIGIRTALLATVVLPAALAHADWRKTPLTTGDNRKDAISDFKELHKKRPNDPPPTTTGKLPGGVKIENVPGTNIIRVDIYPNHVARLELQRPYVDVLVADPGLIDVLPSRACKPVMMGKAGNDETVGNAADNNDGCEVRSLIIQAKTPPNSNGAPPTSPGAMQGAVSAPSGGSAASTASATNIFALDYKGDVVANVMVNMMPSWQRFEEGKVEIHKTGNLASFVNYQCTPICRRVPDPAENFRQGVAPPGTTPATMQNTVNGGNSVNSGQ
jgi:hypothetical protein